MLFRKRFVDLGILSLVLLTGASACARSVIPPVSPNAIPGIPDRPDLIAVVPFYEKANETDDEQTKVVIPAEVDGRRGIFIVDLGCPQLYLNRTFFQLSPTGGVDTITSTNRILEYNGDTQEDTAHVAVLRIGTLATEVIDPTLPVPNPHRRNAVLNHAFGNYYNFAPRLGNIGLSVLEPFETIIDYTNRRLILIRLDSAGHRRTSVPAYTPIWSAPLVDWVFPPASGARFVGEWDWGIQARVDGVTETFIFDTGSPVNVVSPVLATHLVNGVLDHLMIANRTFDAVPAYSLDEGYDLNILGYPFLRQFGVIGLNHRTHQFLLYR